MVKIALASVIALTSGTAFAQMAAPQQPQQQPVQTLVAPDLSPRLTGWYLAPTVGFTTIGGQLGYLPGLRGVLILNHRFGVGLAGSLMATDDSYLLEGGVRQMGAYGGAYGQYIFRTGDLVHAYADLTIGSGRWCQQSAGDDCAGREFVFAEPTVNVELNISRNVRLATGVGYRFAIAERNQPSQSRRDLSGIVARTSIVVGAL